ncbi:FAD-dependent monooxygenase (plasmid) [Photobacterium sp. GJ3]|uniref:FAD-dependent monooxygenase n=1 Tax=Photobacterium sp. GJ3 TaxID=2829502 RepID=UPI001B8D7E79|nr:FAD-dependent monooxygenase [Photobacterium sp. GJ3]QUJ70218.1 FAD-dependent monooxygenase [Photobacterium sp. GJ3]
MSDRLQTQQTLIIGAGIGGLTLANLLSQKNLPFTIAEKSEEIRAVGAGIILPSNAMRILDVLGLSQQIVQNGHEIHRFSIHSKQGKTLNQIQVNHAGQGSAVAIPRSCLHQLLADAIEPSQLHLGHGLESLHPVEKSCEFENGLKCHYDVLVGADGIRSRVREQIFGQEPLRDARQFCFRGLVTLPDAEGLSHQFYELWGIGLRFGFVRVNAAQFYWYATLSELPAQMVSDRPIEMLRKVFSDWWWPVKSLLDAQQEDALIETPLFDRKPKQQWHNDNGVVLLGDAIHPITPNLGQGAAMAIESAYSLAEAIAENPVSPDFSSYVHARRNRTAMINQQSWMIGQLANIRHPMLCRLREMAMSLATDRIATAQYRKMINWFPDSLAAGCSKP